MEQTPFNITCEVQEKKTLIRITGEIGWDTNSEMFRKWVDDAIAQGSTSAHLYLNGAGGSCFDAAEIVNIMSVFNGNVTGEGGALVASAYTYIAAHCSNFTMPANGMFMIHKPSGGSYGTSNDMESYLKLLKDTEAEYLRTLLVQASNTALFMEKWEAGDWWMTASEAKEQGFVSEVREKVKMDKQTTALITASGCPQVLIPISNENNINMTENYKPIASALGLKDDAKEAEILARIGEWKSLNDTVTALSNDKKELQGKLDAIATAEKEAKLSAYKEELKLAAKDGRLDFDAEGKVEARWLKMFDASPEDAMISLSELPKRQPAFGNLPTGGVDGAVKLSAMDKRRLEIQEDNKK